MMEATKREYIIEICDFNKLLFKKTGITSVMKKCFYLISNFKSLFKHLHLDKQCTSVWNRRLVLMVNFCTQHAPKPNTP